MIKVFKTRTRASEHFLKPKFFNRFRQKFSSTSGELQSYWNRRLYIRIRWTDGKQEISKEEKLLFQCDNSVFFHSHTRKNHFWERFKKYLIYGLQNALTVRTEGQNGFKDQKYLVTCGRAKHISQTAIATANGNNQTFAKCHTVVWTIMKMLRIFSHDEWSLDCMDSKRSAKKLLPPVFAVNVCSAQLCKWCLKSLNHGRCRRVCHLLEVSRVSFPAEFEL